MNNLLSKKPIWIIAIVLILTAIMAIVFIQLGSQKTGNYISKLGSLVDSELAHNTDEEIIAQIESVTSAQIDLPLIDEELRPTVEKEAYLSFTSSQSSYKVGDTIIVDVILATHMIPDAVEYSISYDPKMISEVDIETINIFGSYLSKKNDTEKGKITAILLREPGEEFDVSRPLLLLRITALARQAGDLAFVFDQHNTGVAAAAGQAILKDVENLTVNIK